MLTPSTGDMHSSTGDMHSSTGDMHSSTGDMQIPIYLLIRRSLIILENVSREI